MKQEDNTKTFKPGDRALVSSGSFAGFEALVERVEEEGVRVEIEIFGRKTPVVLKPEELTPAASFAPLWGGFQPPAQRSFSPGGYAVTADRKQLIFLDSFGLTRLTLPTGKVRTDRTASGGPGPRLALDASGKRLHACIESRNRGVIYQLPGLKPLRKRRGGPFLFGHLHPDGEHLLWAYGGKVSLYDLQGEQRGYALLDPKRATRLGELTLGPAPSAPSPGKEILRVAPDGAFALYTPRLSLLQGGHLGDERDNRLPYWEITLRVRSGCPVTLQPGEDGTFFAARDPAQSLAYSLHILPDGSYQAREHHAITLPVRVGGSILYQKSFWEVIEERPSGEIESFRLPGAEGPGTLLAFDEERYFVPWHRESIINLRSGEEIPRGLPVEEQPLREDLLARVRRIRPAFHEVGADIALCDLSFSTSGRSFGCAVANTPLDPNDLRARIVMAYLVSSFWEESEEYEVGGYRRASWGLGYAMLVWRRTITEEDLLGVFALLDRYQIPLPKVLSPLREPLERYPKGRSEYRPPGEPEEIMTPGAERLLLCALLDMTEPGAEGTRMSRVPSWRDADLSLERVRERIRAPPLEDGPADLAKILALLLVRIFGEACLPVLLDLLLERDYRGDQHDSYTGISEAIKLLARRNRERRAHVLQKLQEWMDTHEEPYGRRHYIEALRRDLA